MSSSPPVQVGPFTVAFPEPISWNGGPYSEIVYTFDRTEMRSYGDMVVARYVATKIPDFARDARFCFVVHGDTGFKDTLAFLLCQAYARWTSTQWYNTQQGKTISGVSRPLSVPLMNQMDGSVRPRGMCGACRMISYGLYATVDLTLPVYWEEIPE